MLDPDLTRSRGGIGIVVRGWGIFLGLLLSRLRLRLVRSGFRRWSRLLLHRLWLRRSLLVRGDNRLRLLLILGCRCSLGHWRKRGWNC